MDGELAAAVLLLGSERGRQLLGCDWGTAVSTRDDPYMCVRRARQIVVLHGGGEPFDVKVCWVHRARLYAETNPRGGE